MSAQIPDLSAISKLENQSDAGPITVFKKPITPNPFVNAGLTSLGINKQGEEQFWISCVNTLMGATSVLITEDGEFKSYQWTVGEGIRSIYSVAKEDDDTLWVTGGASEHFVRLTLSTSKWETFPREAGRFITAGMALDPETGKLFCSAQTALVTFDTRTRKTVRVYQDTEKPPDNFHYDHWQLSDGSYGFIVETPGLSFVRWDPKTDEVTWKRLTDDSTHPTLGLVRKLNYIENGNAYIAHFGWLDGLTGTFSPHEHTPEEEACWIGKHKDTVYGIQYDPLSVSAQFIAWNPDTGKTKPLFTVPDTPIMNCALTQSGKIVLVDLYGYFRRYCPKTGTLELTRDISAYNAHLCNVIIPAKNNRVIGAPFIAQNFWEFSTQKKEGFYAGRAGGALGQIDYAVEVGEKVYFVAYGGGQLTCYNPDKPANFPRNPHLVAQNKQGQHGSGITTNGEIIWVAFKPKYGTLDGAMIRYNTTTGEATYCNGAIKDQHILNPIFDAQSNTIVASTSYLSDCETATPVHEKAFAVVLDPDTMAVIKKVSGPKDVDTITNHGPLNENSWLMSGAGQLYVFNTETETLSPYEKQTALPEGTAKILSTGHPGQFILQRNNQLEVWNTDSNTFTPLATLGDGFVQRWWVHGSNLTFDCGQYAAIWRDVLTS